MRFLALAAGEVDLATGRTTLPGAVRLTERECLLLASLAREPGQTVAREALERLLDTSRGASDTLVYRLRQKIERDPSDPQHLCSSFNRGLRFVPLQSGALASSGIPPQRVVLLGREIERAEVEHALACGLVTLVGPAGAGKTTLAAAVARRAEASRVIFVDGAAARTRADLVGALGRSLGLASPGLWPEATVTEQVIHTLAEGGGALLVLDNLEQIVDAAALVARIRAESPAVRVLCTSRLALDAIPPDRLPAILLALAGAHVALVEQRPEDARRVLDALPRALPTACARDLRALFDQPGLNRKG